MGHAEGLSVRLSFDHGRRSLVVTKVIAEEWHEHGPRRSIQGTHEAFKAAFGVHHFARRKPGEKADLDSGGRAAGAHREDMQELRHGEAIGTDSWGGHDAERQIEDSLAPCVERRAGGQSHETAEHGRDVGKVRRSAAHLAYLCRRQQRGHARHLRGHFLDQAL